MWNRYDNYRSVRTLKGVVRLQLKIRWCETPECERLHQAYRPEQESEWALPRQEFGLDVVALVGALRYQQHQSVPQIHQHLLGRGVCVSERSVSNLLGRYDELLAVHLGQPQRIQSLIELFRNGGTVSLAQGSTQIVSARRSTAASSSEERKTSRGNAQCWESNLPPGAGQVWQEEV